MSKKISWLAVVSILFLFGAGCRLGPRIVQAPENIQPQKAQVAEEVRTNKTVLNQADYESATGNALAYLKLDGASAQVTRGGAKYAGVDGLELASGDGIKVTTGTAYIVYLGNGASRLDAGTEVVLLAGSDIGMLMQLQLTAGRVWTRLERLLGPGESYAVEANGVVATVRGTAFGVEVQGDGVEVQVADKQVELSSSAILDPAVDAKKYLTVVAGEGIKLAARQFATADAAALKTLVRRLSIGERLAEGYVFGTRSLEAALLNRPPQPLKLRAAPSVPEEYQDKIQYMQFLRAIDSRVSSTTFMAPQRGVLESEVATSTGAPVIQGPSIGL